MPLLSLIRANFSKVLNVESFSNYNLKGFSLVLVKFNSSNHKYPCYSINMKTYFYAIERRYYSFDNCPNRTFLLQPSSKYNRNFSSTNMLCKPLNENNFRKALELRHMSTLYYVLSVVILVVGLSYAAVPLYRLFCQAYSYGGTVQENPDSSKIESMAPLTNKEITIRFNADIASSLNWNFKPMQPYVKVHPGETALAFYTARNPTDKQIIGISTYNVIPFEAGQYFNKIQCFCFEEQMLNPHEQVSMPVFFYIDPEFSDDPKMELVEELTLSYTFFEVKEGLNLPLPGFASK